MMAPDKKVEVFFARWAAFLVVTFSLLILIRPMLQIDISGLMAIAMFGPLILFFRKELFRIFHYWYLMIRGTPPRDFWDFVEGVDNSA